MAAEVTPAEMESVAAKLNEFAAGLPDSEQRALAWMIAHAEAEDDEVSGYLGALSGGLAGPQPRVTVRRPPGGGQQGIIAILIGL